LYSIFLLNSREKRTEFPLKTDRYPDLKPYIRFPAIKLNNKPTQRLPAGVQGSTGHLSGAYQPAQFSTKSMKQYKYNSRTTCPEYWGYISTMNNFG